MPNIRPLSELRNNTTAIANMAHAESAPVFITRNGYADLVVMSNEAYELALARLEMYDKLAQSQTDAENGQLLSIKDAFEKYRAKHGERT
jgi:PHD/YefM family antitoxin component YafN of YafNO toxin-antitoxin module